MMANSMTSKFMIARSVTSKPSWQGAIFVWGVSILLMLNAGCKKNDDFVHVNVYSQAGARCYPILEARFRHFSHERAKLPSGRKILVSAVMEEDLDAKLADPAYRSQGQIFVLSSEQEAAVDPGLAAEFVHARKACNQQIPCFLLIPSSVTGEEREAAEQLLDFVIQQTKQAPNATAQPTPVPATQDQVNPVQAEPATETPAPPISAQ